MSNNLASTDPSVLPYYVATYKGRSVAVKRDANYETTIKLIQKSIPKLRTADIQDIFISTTLADYGDALVQISEEIWPDVVNHVKTVEITLEGDDTTVSDPVNTRAGSVTWTARDENTAVAAVTANQVVQDSRTLAASRRAPADSVNTSTDPRDSLSITIRTPSQTLLELDDLRSSTRIKNVKSLIEDKYGMPAALLGLDLLGKPLDDSATLAQSNLTSSSILDLIVAARQYMIYLCPVHNGSGRYLNYQNVEVKLSLNRAWELAALRRLMGPLSKSYVQSVSWTGDVARNRELTNHESSSKLSYLFWDGVAQPIQSASLAPDPPSSQFAESSQIGHWRLTSMLDPQNSVAVPFGEVQSYIHNLFNALGFSGTIPAYPTEFAVHLKKKPHEYLALRFMPQAECNTIAPFSISPPTDHIIRIFVLYKGLSAQTANIWGGCEPSYSQGAGIWKDIAGLTGAGWGCLNVVEISWMEVL